jgi:hypothetical protein
MFGFKKTELGPLPGSRSVFIEEPGSGSRFNEYGTADKYLYELVPVGTGTVPTVVVR